MRALIGVILTVFPCVLCERILLLTPLGTKSHKIFYMGIVEELAERGHHITIVSSYAPSKDQKNVKEVTIPFDMNLFAPSNIFEKSNAALPKVFLDAPSICADVLGLKEVQDLNEQKFDLVIISMFFDYCFLSFVHRLQVPFIYIFSSGLSGFLHDLVNNIDFPGIVPHKMSAAQFPLTFMDRLKAVAINTLLSVAVDFYIMPSMDSICRERGLCPEDMPYLKEISDNASLAIVNSVRSFEYPPRPVNPNIIQAGGAHIKLPKKLPQDLEKWVEDSGEHGFILFSIGSALKPSLLPEKYRKILVNVFESLKQKVLWKWDEESMPDLPKNVKLSKWLPQSDILGHPKLRLFITHGGLLSTMESTYNGIPIIGMPIFADQFANMKEAESEGWGKIMSWKNLEENVFRRLILDTINDESLREISKRRSVIFKDRPMQPAEEAAFWVEYVIRHKGAPHLMSATIKMRWYEVYNMDVWALIIATILCIFYLQYRIILFIFYKCCVKPSNSKEKRKAE